MDKQTAYWLVECMTSTTSTFPSSVPYNTYLSGPYPSVYIIASLTPMLYNRRKVISLSLSLDQMGGKGDSPPSSIDSSSHPALSAASSLTQPIRKDLSTDLRLGLSLPTSSLQDSSSNARNQFSDWPPIKPLLRSTLSEKGKQQHPATFFIKVYMEGILIGRKLDLFAQGSYESLIQTLCHMFRTPIMFPSLAQVPPKKAHVLTYEDKEGDWMMVGDVPWEMFLTTVKRLKITRADRC